MKPANLSLLAAVLLLSTGCAMERSAIRGGDNRSCVANYTTSGHFVTGKQFRTYQIFHGVSVPATFDRVSAVIASKGFQITSSDKQAGTLTAIQQFGATVVKQVPLQASVKPEPSGGTKVELAFTLTALHSTSADAVQDGFCDILTALPAGQLAQAPKGAAGTAGAAPAQTTKTRSVMLYSQAVRETQQQLAGLGYTPGPADGVPGSKTVAALKQFQTDYGLPVTGRLDAETTALLKQLGSLDANPKISDSSK